MSQHTHRGVALSAIVSCSFIFGITLAQAGVGAPNISKAFNPTSIVAGSTSTITLTLSNPFGADLTNASFTDMLSNIAISGAQAAGGSCTGAATNNFTNNATALSFSGITVLAGSNCTVTVVVTSSTVGANPNTTSGVTTTEFPSAGPGSNTATLTVTPLAVTFQSFDVN